MVWNFCLIWIILSKSASFCDLVMQIYYATYCTYFMDIPLFGYIPWLREIKFILLLLEQ